METYRMPITDSGRAVYLVLPFDAKAVFHKPKGAIHVLATVNGVPCRGRLVSLGGGTQAFFLNKELQARLGYTGQPMEVEADFALIGDTAAAIEPGVARACGMDVLEAITTRVSIRRFTAEPLSEEAETTLLHAGFCAPSATNKRPWHFVVVKGTETRAKLAAGSPYAKMVAEAPLAIAICGDKMLQGMTEFVLEDCAAAAQNMLLAAHGLGLGGVWCGVRQGQTFYKAVQEALALPDKIIPVAVMAFGHPAEKREPKPRYEAGKVHLETW